MRSADDPDLRVYGSIPTWGKMHGGYPLLGPFDLPPLSFYPLVFFSLTRSVYLTLPAPRSGHGGAPLASRMAHRSFILASSVCPWTSVRISDHQWARRAFTTRFIQEKRTTQGNACLLVHQLVALPEFISIPGKEQSTHDSVSYSIVRQIANKFQKNFRN